MDDNHDIEPIPCNDDDFYPVPSIAYTLSLEEIAGFAQEHEKSGIPYVITGLPFDGGDHERSPLLQSSEWLENIYHLRTNNDAHIDEANAYTDQTCLPCPMEWSNWLQTSDIVPSFLTPGGSDDMLPAPIGKDSCRLQVGGPAIVSEFSDNPDSVSAQHLLCLGNANSPRYWFLTSANDYGNVWDHLRKRDGSNEIRSRALDVQELSDAPFTVYIHKQVAGDLLVVPPRCFGQQVNKGITASLRWHRMTLGGLKIFIYHDQHLKQRLCIPSKYCVKQILHDNLQSRVRELTRSSEAEPNDRAAILVGCKDLADMLGLFEEVLTSGFCNDDEAVPILSLATPPQFCAFCGGELFRSVFSCTGGCERDQDQPGNKITLCGSCYVDGRTCECGIMEPRRLQPLAEFLKVRDDIHGLLLDLTGDSRDEVFPQGEMVTNLSNGACGVFAAAMALCKLRGSITETRTCTPRIKPSHRAPEFEVVQCDGCHAKRCYKHILSTYSIHSSVALTANHVNRGSGTWHSIHQACKDAYAKQYTQLKVAVKHGIGHPLDHRLAFYASAFASTTPINKAVRSGFYDAAVSDKKKVQQSETASQGKEPGSPSTTTSASITTDVFNPEASGSRTRPTIRRGVASQDPGPSASQKRSISSQESDYVPRKRSRLASNSETRTKTRGTTKGKLSRGTSGKLRAEKGKGRARTAGVSKRLNRVVSSEDSTSESDLPLIPTHHPEGSGSRHDITPPRSLSTSIHRESQRTPGELHRSSSPLHQPLAHFDPDTDIVDGEEQQPPPRDNFRSAWETLLEAHTAPTFRQQNGRESNDLHLHAPTPTRHPAVPDGFSSPLTTSEPGSIDPQTLEPRAESGFGDPPPGNGRASWFGRIVSQETRVGNHLHRPAVGMSLTLHRELQHSHVRDRSINLRRASVESQRPSIISRNPSIESNSSTASGHRHVSDNNLHMSRGSALSIRVGRSSSVDTAHFRPPSVNHDPQPILAQHSTAQRSGAPHNITSNPSATGQDLPLTSQRRPENSHIAPTHTSSGRSRPIGTRLLGDSVSVENLDSYIRIMEASRATWEAQDHSTRP